MGDTGLEQPPKASGKTPFSKTPGAKSGAVPAEPLSTDPDLQLILANWPKVPDALRQGILALIRSAVEK